jgi:uncharacterized membrane protein
MSWILLAAGAQFLSAIVALLDKYIVSDEKLLPQPFVYAFYTCLIAGLWVVIYVFGLIPLPWGINIPSFTNVHFPTISVALLSLASGGTFFIALVWLFKALRASDASDVIPVVGAMSAVASFVLSYMFLGSILSQNFIFGILLLTLGTFLVSRLRFPPRIAILSILAGMMFGLHYVLIKGLFEITTFDNGFFWSRLGFVAVALSTLLMPWCFRIISKRTKGVGKRGGAIILVNKFLAGISAILILKATDLGDVAVVQALGGLQFVFILAIGMLVGHKTPSSCGEESCRRREVVHKAIFVSIITLGFLVLFV